MSGRRNTVREYVAALKGSSRFGPQVVAHRVLAARQPELAATDILPAELTRVLAELGINALYNHQAEAIELISRRQNVLVATPTASGKSLIYNLPVFATLLANPGARALYIFPLKALAQDQLRAIEQIGALLPPRFRDQCRNLAAIYDGDTSGYRRRKIRGDLPAILITNPDMLHLALLPYHDLWSGLFAELTHVIIDEVHTYRGVFGSHMAWVLRRLQRICRLYGSDPTFVLSSATVGNPQELARDLINADVRVIDSSGAPTPPRNVILINPLDSAAHAATMLLAAALHRGLRTIVYTQSRKMTELVTMWARRRLSRFSDRIASYRAGFLPEDRRRIERALADGDLLAVISTSALELGIDIGSLDICILVGYPGSMMATWQRAGRVGRGRRESLVVLVGHEDALDQYFMRNPDDFFRRPVEAVVLNPRNPAIAGPHLVCAAAELPIEADDPLCTAETRPILQKMAAGSRLLQSADGSTWFSSRRYPQRQVDLRGSGDRYRILALPDRRPLGEIDGYRALRECHAGAIYLHMARTWQVDSLDLEGHEILVSAADPPYYTRAMTEKETEILATRASAACGCTRVHFGELRVTETITGYQKILVGRQQVIGSLPLDLPPQIFETEGIWIEIPDHLRRGCEEQRFHFMGGIHAMEHAIIGMLPLEVLCDRNDIGGISHPWHVQLQGAAIFIYDGCAGGVGLTRRAFSRISALLDATEAAVRTCPCEIGCPSCVHSPKCGSGNRPIDKEACLFLLQGVLAAGHPVRPVRTPPPAVAPRRTQPSFSLSRRYGVFDVETRLSAAEVGGWHRADRMRVSVAVLYDSGEDRYFSYQEEEMDQLIERLFSLELVVGFNNKRFDNRVLSPYSGQDLARLPALDILEEITGRLGYRLSLDRLAEHTLGITKSGNGLQALEWFRQGRMEELTRYCRRDVEITRDLFLHGLRQGYLLFRNKAGAVVRLPVDFAAAIRRITAARGGKAAGSPAAVSRPRSGL